VISNVQPVGARFIEPANEINCIKIVKCINKGRITICPNNPGQINPIIKKPMNGNMPVYIE